MKKSEELFRVLFPEGMRYYFVVEDQRDLDPWGCDPCGRGLKVVVPVGQPNVRVLIQCSLMEKKFLWPDAEGGMSSRAELSGSKDSWIYPQNPVFERIIKDETLTVAELDLLLGVNGGSNGDSVWTWERLNAALEEKGIIPEEVAQKYGLS
ncbi:MAG: hypothetical protein ACYCYP_13920 [Leptospirales bacterium]